MTERLADISARIEGVRQLGAVVNAMKGIAAARARTARSQVLAVDSYAATIAEAVSTAIGPDAARNMAPAGGATGLLVFCAEQGFAGAFSERVLDGIGADLVPERLFLIGTRGLSVAAARGITPMWSGAMPSHSPGIPKLADRITNALYAEVSAGRIARLEVVYTTWDAGRPSLLRHGLFPIDLADLPPALGTRPLMQLSPADLLDRLGMDHVHALICKAALHAYAAENEARMEAMSAAATQIERELEVFQATLRRVRQETITAEIIELGTGAAAAG